MKNSLHEKKSLFSRSDIDINTIYYEISGICNAKCKYCPTGSGATKGRPARFIPPDEFSRGLNKLYELDFLNNRIFFGLYNWGDPLLHPQINEIMYILKEAEQPFALSTNGSFIPKNINFSLLDNLSYIRFSLPGFSQKSYDKIHQVNFEKVLQNISILNEIVPPNTLEVFVFAYKFNIEEIFKAADYFSNSNIRFRVAMPHLTDFDVTMSYLTETIDHTKKQKIEEDLYTDYIKPLLLTRDNKIFCSKLQNELVIDEFNNILTCCILSKNNEYYSVGSLFELTKEGIFAIKTSGQPVCQKCFSAGVPFWYIQSHKCLPNVLQTLNTLTYCYINTGRGFSNIQKVECNSYPKPYITQFKISFDLKKYSRIESLRWDPVKGRLCQVYLDKIQVVMNNGETHIVQPQNLCTNAERISDKEFLFHTIDPWIVIPIEGLINNVIITGNWVIRDLKETIPLLNDQLTNITADLNKLNRHAQDLEATVASNNAQIHDLKATVASSNVQKSELKNRIQSLNEENEAMKQSITFKFTSNFHRVFIEGLFPQNSGRRRYYDLGLKGGRILVNEGLKSLWRRFAENISKKPIPQKKFFPEVHEKEISSKEHYELSDKNQEMRVISTENGLYLPENVLSQSLKDLFKMNEEEIDGLYSLGKKGKLRVLVIDAIAPSHDQDSGSLRMYRMLQCFTELECDVTFIPSNLEFNKYCTDLKKIGVDVYSTKYIDISTFIDCYAKSFNLIIVSRFTIAQKFLPLIRKKAPNSLLVFDTVDLHFLRLERQDLLHFKKVRPETKNIENQEFKLMALSDITLVVSPIEFDLIRERRPDINVQILSNIHEILYTYVPFQNRDGIVFIGGFNHTPNVDAIQFFIREIYPRIKNKLNSVPIYIVGSNPPEVIKKLASDRVIITGFIPDVSNFFKTCRLSISPLRYGAGVKGKINMSMAYGLPVVTTSIGAEGMYLENNVNAIIADDPADFANGIVDLYYDEEKWNKISLNSVKNIEKYFSMDCAKNNIVPLIQEARQ